MGRSQFTFYDSFLDAISKIKDKRSRCDAYDAIARYALRDENPDIDKLPDAAAIAFLSFRPSIDASRRKSEGAKKKDTAKIPKG